MSHSLGLPVQPGPPGPHSRGDSRNTAGPGAESPVMVSDVIGPVTAGSTVVHVAGFVAIVCLWVGGRRLLGF